MLQRNVKIYDGSLLIKVINGLETSNFDIDLSRKCFVMSFLHMFFNFCLGGDGPQAHECYSVSSAFL